MKTPKQLTAVVGIGVLVLIIIWAYFHQPSTRVARTITVDLATYGAAAIQHGIDEVQDGDTLFLPAGDYYLTNGFHTHSKAFWMRGAGVDLVNIYAYTTNRSQSKYVIGNISHSNEQLPMILSGMTFRDRPGQAQISCGLLQFYVKSPTLIMTNCDFTDYSSRPFYYYNMKTNGYAGGVFAYCRFLNTQNGGGTFWDATANGRTGENGYWEWANDVPWGTTNMPVMESCIISNASQTYNRAFIDGRTGMEMMIRYCIFYGASVQNHESEHRMLWPRAIDCNNNIFYNSKSGSQSVYLRGGTALIWGNTNETGSALLSMNYYPLLSCKPGLFEPWGPASGTNVWNENGPVIYTGTHTGIEAILELTDEKQNWQPNEIAHYTVLNLTTRYSAMILSNDAHTAYMAKGIESSQNMRLTTGDKYQIAKVLRAVGQPGAGKMAEQLCCGTDAKQAKPTGFSDSIEPIYIWDNKGVTNVSAGQYSHLIIKDVHYIFGPKPGYKPLEFPHPLLVAYAPPVPITNAPPNFSILTTVTGTNGFSITTLTITDGTNATASVVPGTNDARRRIR